MPCLALRTRGCSVLRPHQRHTATAPSSLLPCRRSGSSVSGESTHAKGIRDVPILPSWNSTVFQRAYKQNLPARLPRSRAHLPPACSKWFVHDNNPAFDLFNASTVAADEQAEEGRVSGGISLPRSSELRTSFWSGHESTFVPLEITTKGVPAPPSACSILGDSEGFERIEAPLKILIAYLSKSTTIPDSFQADNGVSIYLAQCDLASLPDSMRSDVPIPKLLHASSSSGTIKGDIYASSLWLGRPPTYTPVHRDPNPNLFIQLAGQKIIRLLPPEIGDALYHEVTATLSPTSTSFSAAIRGEEMMIGPQKVALHDAIWSQSSIYNELVQSHGLQTTLGLGDALFTPKGWWHSVKGVGEGVTASVNWWFR